MEKRAKEVTEKKASLFTEKKKVNLVESLATEALAKKDELLGQQIPIFNLLDDKKENIEKHIDPVIADQIASKDAKEESAADRTKSEEEQRKLYFKEINKFNQTQIATDYRTSMQKLQVSYS
jgi:hypothetical protein